MTKDRTPPAAGWQRLTQALAEPQDRAELLAGCCARRASAA